MNMLHIDRAMKDMLAGKFKHVKLSEACVRPGGHVDEHQLFNSTAPKSAHTLAVCPQSPDIDLPPRTVDDPELGHHERRTRRMLFSSTTFHHTRRLVHHMRDANEP